ncbi:MAG: hypothetical protein IJO63_02430 [Bacilli bacterium]|nr:hypothetical protein [Bacilli bacterium]
MKKKNIVILTIFVIVLMTSIALAFAYIGKPTNTGTTTANMQIKDISNGITMAYSGNTSVALEISWDNLSLHDASNTYTSYISKSTTMAVKMTTSSDFTKGATCSYSIKYIPTTAFTSSTAAKNAGLKEFVVAGSAGSLSFADYSLADKTTEVTMYTGSIATTSTTTVTHNWTITLKFYNLAVDQNSVMGQTPKGTLSIVPGACVANV